MTTFRLITDTRYSIGYRTLKFQLLVLLISRILQRMSRSCESTYPNCVQKESSNFKLVRVRQNHPFEKGARHPSLVHTACRDRCLAWPAVPARPTERGCRHYTRTTHLLAHSCDQSLLPFWSPSLSSIPLASQPDCISQYIHTSNGAAASLHYLTILTTSIHSIRRRFHRDHLGRQVACTAIASVLFVTSIEALSTLRLIQQSRAN